MLSRISRIALWIALICATDAKASHRVDAALLLASLPSTSNQDVIILDGVVRSVKDVDHWDVTVNDAIAVTVRSQNASERVPIRVAITLRPGNNVIGVNAIFTNSRSQRWTTNILRTSPEEGQRYALLISGETTTQASVSPLASLRAALEDSGIPTENIWTGSRYSDLKNRLANVAKEARTKDRVLVYYLGDSTLFGATGEPMLKVASDSPSENSGILFSDLVRQVEGFDLPSLSLLVDTEFDNADETQSARGSSQISAFANAERMGAPWLRTLSLQPNLEIAMSNVLNKAPGAVPGDFTRSFLSLLNAPIVPSGPCKALSDVIVSMDRSPIYGQSGTPPRPLYFAEDPTTPSFCFSRPDEKAGPLKVVATAVQSQMHPYTAGSISATIPRSLAVRWAEIFVDEVLLRHIPIGTDESHQDGFQGERIPMSRGTHLIEVRAGVGTSVLASGTTQLTVPADKEISMSSVSGALSATLLEPDEPNSATTDAMVNLDFVVEDKEKGAVQFEVRDNGVVVIRGQSLRLHPGQKLEVFRRILLSPGLNNIVVEVGRAGLYSQARATIMRRAGQSLRAVIVGPDSYQSLTPTPSARADAELIQDLLLRYTEVAPEQITLLTGRSATRAAIETSIATAVSTKPSDPFPYGDGGEETLFLYFAGLGTTTTAGNREAVRCILPYDADPARLAETCVSTSEIDKLLDSWNRSIIVFDTSYDGLAGQQPPSTDAHELTSRTYSSYFAKDATWRLSAGIDRNNRVFVVGSGTNSASLEDNVTGHGLFTSALVDSVQAQLAQPTTSSVPQFRELSLSEAYSGARNRTAAVTTKRQIPVIKGVLAHPFSFAAISTSELKQRASATLARTKRDVESLRLPDNAQLQRASALLSKALAINPSDTEARHAFAEIRLFQGNVEGAKQLVDEAVSATRAAGDGAAPSSLALWLTLSAQIKMRNGDLAGAITDCEDGVRSFPGSLKAAYLLGELYAANLQYDKSLQVLNELVDNFGTTTGSDNLTDEEWGRTMLWTYIALRRTDAHGNPRAKLHDYAASNPQSGLLFRVLLENKLAKTIFPHSDRPDKTLNLDLQETWSHLVADYLLDPKGFEEELRSFREMNLIFDPKDRRSFDCMLHFYLGMNAVFEGERDLAKQEFSSVVDTAQMQYPEFWTARGELSKLQSEGH
jgi:tetratricopeptide (TPR) repeat protein